MRLQTGLVYRIAHALVATVGGHAQGAPDVRQTLVNTHAVKEQDVSLTEGTGGPRSFEGVSDLQAAGTQ